MTVSEEMVERAYNRFMQANSETVDCPRCKARGYHHGFGEHGHDPDWCETCGGPGLVPKFDEMSAMREALTAALSDQPNGWQDISTAPKDGTAIWLLVEGRPYIGYGEPDWLTEKLQWHAKASFRRKAERPPYRVETAPDEIFGCNGHDVRPTRWQPLPAPPPSSTAGEG